MSGTVPGVLYMLYVITYANLLHPHNIFSTHFIELKRKGV